MDNRLGATFSDDHKAAARIIIALAHSDDRIARIGNFRVRALTILVAGGDKLDKTLSLALR